MFVSAEPHPIFALFANIDNLRGTCNNHPARTPVQAQKGGSPYGPAANDSGTPTDRYLMPPSECIHGTDVIRINLVRNISKRRTTVIIVISIDVSIFSRGPIFVM